VTTERARYDTIGHGYADRRQPDPRLAERIWAAIGDARSIVNVGAGTGSYEDGSGDRPLIAVDPSHVMLRQRPTRAAPAIAAAAEHLPFASRTFDVALGILTAHHWSDLQQGLAELRRVSRRQVVLTIDTDVHDAMWLCREYVPAIVGLSDGAPLNTIVNALDAHTVDILPIPADCRDGFLMAYWNRPELYLDPIAQSNTSAFALLSREAIAPGLARLKSDLADGTWHHRHGDLLHQTEFDAGLRLVIAG
jgi:SAM-dependent methyltransferase